MTGSFALATASRKPKANASINKMTTTEVKFASGSPLKGWKNDSKKEYHVKGCSIYYSPARKAQILSKVIATNKQVNPSENDNGSNLTRNSRTDSKPRKRIIFKTNKATPVLILPLPAKGAKTKRMPKVRSKKLTPINKPPRRRDLDSTMLVEKNATQIAVTKTMCTTSIRKTVGANDSALIAIY